MTTEDTDHKKQSHPHDVVWTTLLKKMEVMEKQIEELVKKQTLLQDAFYRLYENQRRTERVL